MPDSRDYIFLSGAKELLDEVQLNNEITYPWDTAEVEEKRQIVKQYLEHRYNVANKKING